MREKVRAFMEQYHMVTAGERVLLGLSGGADSVCLFHLLRELQEPLGFSLQTEMAKIKQREEEVHIYGYVL